MGSWGTDQSIPVSLRKILHRKVVENGVRKKTPTYRYFARKWSWRNMCFQVRAISSRLWFTYIFASDSGSLSIAGGWKSCGTLLIFNHTVVLVCPYALQLQEKQEARVKGLAVACFRKRPEIDPPVSRYINMKAAARCGGSSIRPTLSTTWLSRSLASEARHSWCSHSWSWPAMRVISLGIRTVPVLSVAKKLAAPRPTPTAQAAKCGLIRQDEADWLWLSIGCWKTFALLFFSSLLEVITGRGELTECSKLTCFAKRMLDMVPGGSGQWDRRSVSAAIKDSRRTCQFDCELGKGKTYASKLQSSRKNKKPE